MAFTADTVAVVTDSQIERVVLATEETTVTQQVSHRPIKFQSRSWSQRGTKVNGLHHVDNRIIDRCFFSEVPLSYAICTYSTRWSPVLSTCPLHTISGCGQERRILIGPWGPFKAALVWKYPEVYWACAGGLSAVNAFDTQLRDPINSGLTRWRMAV